MGGGFSLNPFVTMAEAYKVAKPRSKYVPATNVLASLVVRKYPPGRGVGLAPVVRDFCLVNINSDDVTLEYGMGNRADKLLFDVCDTDSKQIVATFTAGKLRWYDKSNQVYENLSPGYCLH